MKKTILILAILITTLTQANAWDQATQNRIDSASRPTGETGRTVIRKIFNIFGYNTPQQEREQERERELVQVLYCGVDVDCQAVTGR